MRAALRLLLSLVKNNVRVKSKLFYSINVLLELKCAVKQLTELLKEVRAAAHVCSRTDDRTTERDTSGLHVCLLILCFKNQQGFVCFHVYTFAP